ncbi:MAG: hypothetical protein DRN35_00205 [Thermoplasmata archaeon]|nr:MAG: hypothetical protein DRN40_05805 [Thermoplasmata archaeon]RLF72611.1 MAG: hypothetical protein DRN35_00205 [Thermoplasmata archaeon]RLF74187.1 MAG: hypothetical protein DRN55_00940 [Thermoplasmata archaeon]
MGYSLTLTSVLFFSFFLFSFYFLYGTLREFNELTDAANDLKEERDRVLKNTDITMKGVLIDGKNLTFTFENSGYTSLDVDHLTFIIEGVVIEKENLTLTLEEDWEEYWQVGDELVVEAYLPNLSLTSSAGDTAWLVTPPTTPTGNITIASGDHIYCLILNSSSPTIEIFNRDGKVVGVVPSTLLNSPLDICVMEEDLLVLNKTSVDRFTSLGYKDDDNYIGSLVDAELITYSHGYVFIGLANGSIIRYTSDGKNQTYLFSLTSGSDLMDIYAGAMLHLFVKKGNFYWIYNLTLGGALHSKMNLSAALSATPLAFSYFAPGEQLVVLTQGNNSHMVYYLASGNFYSLNASIIRDPVALDVGDGIYLVDQGTHTLQKLTLGQKVKIITREGWEGVWEF